MLGSPSVIAVIRYIEMTVYIYSLCDPRTGECRYVGKTKDVENRVRSHVRDKVLSHKTNWIKSLIALGLRPLISVIETIENSNDEDWQDRERFWISEMRRLGCRLTNLDSGGRRGKSMSEETKKKLSEVLSKIEKTPEWRENIRRSRIGSKASEEAKKKMSLARKGKRFTPEHAAKIGQANRGRICSEETRNKISESNRGKVVSPETREKASIALKKRWASGESFVTEETKKKISATLTLRGAMKRGYWECDPVNDCMDVGENHFVAVI